MLMTATSATAATATPTKPITVESLTATIVDAVKRAAPAGAGRPCKLADYGVTHAILTALAHGKSRPAAAKAGGVTEGALRLWLKQGKDGSATYAPLVEAVERIA